eukprot:515605_1
MNPPILLLFLASFVSGTSIIQYYSNNVSFNLQISFTYGSNFRSCDQFNGSMLSTVDQLYLSELESYDTFVIESPPQTDVIYCSDHMIILTTYFIFKSSQNSSETIQLFYQSSILQLGVLLNKTAGSLQYSNQQIHIQSFQFSTTEINMSTFYTTLASSEESVPDSWRFWTHEWWTKINLWNWQHLLQVIIFCIASLCFVLCICCTYCFVCFRCSHNSHKHNHDEYTYYGEYNINNNNQNVSIINHDSDDQKVNDLDHLIDGFDMDKDINEPERQSWLNEAFNSVFKPNSFKLAFPSNYKTAALTDNEEDSDSDAKACEIFNTDKQSDGYIRQNTVSESPILHAPPPPPHPAAIYISQQLLTIEEYEDICSSSNTDLQSNAISIDIETNENTQIHQERIELGKINDNEMKCNDIIHSKHEIKHDDEIHDKVYEYNQLISLMSGNDSNDDDEEEIKYNSLIYYNYDKYEAVIEWFDKIRFPESDDAIRYCNLFIQNGYDTIQEISHMTEKDLQQLPITKPGHKKRILREIQKLKSNDTTITLDSSYHSYHQLTATVTNCDDIDSCHGLSRLSDVMTKCEQNEIDGFEFNIISVLNDFMHLISQHATDFEEIANKLGFCDINKCSKFISNYRDRQLFGKVIENKNYDEQNIAQHQILDKIHCYFQHAFDLGLLLKTEDKTLIE